MYSIDNYDIKNGIVFIDYCFLKLKYYYKYVITFWLWRVRVCFIWQTCLHDNTSSADDDYKKIINFETKTTWKIFSYVNILTIADFIDWPFEYG